MMIPREKRRARLIHAMTRARPSPAESHALAALQALADEPCRGRTEYHEAWGIAGLAISGLYCDACLADAIATAWEAGWATGHEAARK